MMAFVLLNSWFFTLQRDLALAMEPYVKETPSVRPPPEPEPEVSPAPQPSVEQSDTKITSHEQSLLEHLSLANKIEPERERNNIWLSNHYCCKQGDITVVPPPPAEPPDMF